MAITLQALSPADDAQAIASCNATAFWSDKHWRHQHGKFPLSDVISDMALRTPWTLSSGRHRLRCLKAVDTATGQLVGYARWILPASMVGNDKIWLEAVIPEPSKEQWEMFKIDYQSTIDPKTGSSRYVDRGMVEPLGDALGAKDNEIRSKYHDREFLELDYLAVREGWQRRGIGKMLVKTGMEKAEDLGCHLIIMAFTDKGRSLYPTIPGLRCEEEVRQSCEGWTKGRQDGCECLASFWVGLWDGM